MTFVGAIVAVILMGHACFVALFLGCLSGTSSSPSQLQKRGICAVLDSCLVTLMPELARVSTEKT